MWKSRIVLLLAAGAALLLAVGYEDKHVGFTILYSVALLFVAALATILCAPLCIQIEERMQPDAIVKNEEARYTVTIRNRSPFYYPRVSCVFHSGEVVGYGDDRAVINAIGPGRRMTRDYRLRFPYRGVYSIGIRRMVVTDFLGLFRYALPVPRPQTVMVYPQSDDSFALSIRNEPQNSSLSGDLFNEDYTSVADVRKYTSSDSLRKVHWKLSAKRGELIVKNFQSFDPDPTLLFLDTRAMPLSPLDNAAAQDKMIAYVASAIGYCVRGRLPADFIYGQAEADRISIRQLEDIGEIYALLASIPFQGEQPAFSVLEGIAGPYNMVVFLAHMDGTAHDALRELISFDHNLIIYYFYSELLPLTGEKAHLLESLKAYGASINMVEIAKGGVKWEWL